MASQLPIPIAFDGIHFIAKRIENVQIPLLIGKPLENIIENLASFATSDLQLLTRVRGTVDNILPIVVFYKSRSIIPNPPQGSAGTNKPQLLCVGLLFHSSDNLRVVFKIPFAISKVRNVNNYKLFNLVLESFCLRRDELLSEAYTINELVAPGRRKIKSIETVDTDIITPYIHVDYVPSVNDPYESGALQSRAANSPDNQGNIEENSDEESIDDEDAIDNDARSILSNPMEAEGTSRINQQSNPNPEGKNNYITLLTITTVDNDTLVINHLSLGMYFRV